jgi:hypothetical protein
MNSYCVKCKKQTPFDGKPQLFRTKNNRLLLKGPCVECNKTKTTFISKMQGEGLLGSLFKLPGNKIPVLGDIPLIGKVLF